jgi:hypothetical protein
MSSRWKIVLLMVAAIIIGALAGLTKAHAEPSEAEKVEALRLGYILNGFSMKRSLSEGSIDVSQLTNSTLNLSPAPGVVRTIPIIVTPPKKK